VNINGATFHRVYVGPYTSAGEVERVKQQLADNGVPAITVREQAP
jgi:cell division protein FtsN